MKNIAFNFPDCVHEIAYIFHNNGYEMYVVGGVIRDIIIHTIHPTLLENNKNSNNIYDDIDFATNATPQQVQSLFHTTIPTGINHGTITILYKKLSFEVTTYRIDGKYDNHRHPSNILYSTSIYDDLERRDFTINALAVNPIDNNIIDNHNGISDIKSKIIKCVGKARERFSEDALRMLRAIRFATKLQFTLEATTLLAIKELSNTISKISIERIISEFRKIISSPNSYKGIELLYTTNILPFIIPHTIENDSSELIKSLQLCSIEDSINDEALALACCYSKAWKNILQLSPSFNITSTINHIKILTPILKNLKFPNTLINEITLLTSTQHYIKTSLSKSSIKLHLTDFKLKYLVSKHSIERTILILQFLRIQLLVLKSYLDETIIQTLLLEIDKAISQVNTIAFQQQCIRAKDLAINGNDILQIINKPSGKWLGILLGTLHRHVLQYPKDNNREVLTQLINEKYHLPHKYH